MRNFSVLLCFITLILVACGGGRASVVVAEERVIAPQKGGDVKIKLDYNKSFKQGEDVVIRCVIGEQVDSIKLFIRNQEQAVNIDDGRFVVPTSLDSKVGTTNFKVVVYKGEASSTRVGSFLMVPQVEVKQYKARALEIYPHSKSSYTQGLEFYGGVLYESSGEYGKSFIHALEFPSMKVKSNYNLDSKLFAEGLTIINDKIYLLTWQEYRCIVLDSKTLKPIREFQYNTEGWGITNDKKYIYMSDGTQYIYIIDPETFTQVDKLEVMMGDRPLSEINELEWIEGEIWANIFTTDNIARINPRTGAVVGMVDASGLLLKRDYTKDTNVLNGIAYDTQQKKIYLTGKNWPKLFEVVVR